MLCNKIWFQELCYLFGFIVVGFFPRQSSLGLKKMCSSKPQAERSYPKPDLLQSIHHGEQHPREALAWYVL